MPFKSFYKGKKVLITGDTGFKGSWISRWLSILGANVSGLALEPNTHPSLFNILNLYNQIKHTHLDIRKKMELSSYIHKLKPDVIFHLAAQSLVRLSYESPIETLETNIMGTANLLDSVSSLWQSTGKPCFLIIITSDKCYENRETNIPYNEDSPLGGHDIYSMSKSATELLVNAWFKSFFMKTNDAQFKVKIASCRSGNAIGGGDWAQDRILADCIKALSKGLPVQVRNPDSVRPWQHVLEPLSGYLLLGAKMGSISKTCNYCSAWNFGPGDESERTVGELCDRVIQLWGSGSWQHLPQKNAVHESTMLKLSIKKSQKQLGWKPVWDFDQATKETISWYREAYNSNFDSTTMINMTDEQIERYTIDAKKKSLSWV